MYETKYHTVLAQKWKFDKYGIITTRTTVTSSFTDWKVAAPQSLATVLGPSHHSVWEETLDCCVVVVCDIFCVTDL